MSSIYKSNYSSKILVEMWGDFINWEKRRKGEGGFLLKTLKKYKCKKIFDACLGDGADTIYLLKNGLDVTSNDLDKIFIKKAHSNAKKNDVSLKVTSFDWRNLNKHLKKESFDAVICLGNSLTYLFTKNDQLKALKNFLAIIKTGGILFVDERNYQYFLDKKEEILREGKFRYSGKYVYSGDKVHGKPIEITNKKVKMEYTDERNGKKGYLLVYPFKRNELFNLLKEAGFSKIGQFSDYKKGLNSEADYYHYVCVK